MSKWKIKYYCPVEKKVSAVEGFFDQLTNEQFKAVAKELRLLELCGHALRLPHSKPLGHGLFELRERKFGYRIITLLVKTR